VTVWPAWKAPREPPKVWVSLREKLEWSQALDLGVGDLQAVVLDHVGGEIARAVAAIAYLDPVIRLDLAEVAERERAVEASVQAGRGVHGDV
jgi:hypothetical protein